MTPAMPDDPYLCRDPRPAPIPRRRTYRIIIGLMVAAFAVGFLFGFGVGL